MNMILLLVAVLAGNFSLYLVAADSWSSMNSEVVLPSNLKQNLDAFENKEKQEFEAAIIRIKNHENSTNPKSTAKFLNLTTDEDIFKITQESLLKLQNLKEEYEHQTRVLSKIDQKIEKSLSKQKQIKDLTLANKASFRQPVYVKKYEGKIITDGLESFKQALEGMRKNVRYLVQNLAATKENLKDIVPKMGSTKLVHGTKYFYGPQTRIKDLSVSHVHVGNLTGQTGSFRHTIQNLVLKDDSRLIKGTKEFTGDVHIKNLHTSTVNNNSASDYITTEFPVKLKSVIFKNGFSVKNNLILSNDSKIDGIDFSKETVKSGQFHKLGSCYFKNLDLPKGVIVENSKINHKSFDVFTQALLKSKSNLVINGSKNFENLTIEGNLITKSIMNVDSEKLFSNLALKSENEKLKNVIFESYVNCSDVVAGKINNNILPEDFITRSNDFTNFGSKTFDKISFNEVTVQGLVDGLETSDLVTKSGPDKILGTKTFENGIMILGNLNISSRFINNVNIDSIFADDRRQKKSMIFKNPVIVGNLDVKGSINNMDIKNLKSDLVLKRDKNIVITSQKIFSKNLKVEHGRVESVNTIKPDDFVSTKTKNVITGKKVFEKLRVNSMEVKGLIDGSNFTELMEKSFFRNKPNQKVSKIKYLPYLNTSLLQIKQTINKYPVSKLLTKSTDQIMSDITIKSAFFKNLNAKNVVFENEEIIINGMDIPTIKRCREEVELKDTVEVDDILVKNLETVRINGKKLSDLQNVLKTNRDQTIPNDVYFENLVIQGPATTSEHISGNGGALREKIPSALFLHEDNVQDEIYLDTVVADSITVAKFLDGFNLFGIEKDAVFLDNSTSFSIRGPKTFSNGFRTDDLYAKLINGRDIKKLFSKTTAQTIRSKFSFENVKFNNIHVKKFNDVEMDNIIDSVHSRGRTEIKGNLTFTGNVKMASLEVGSKINNFDMEEILKDAVHISHKGGKVIIPGQKKFGRNLNVKNLNLVSLNGNSSIIKWRKSAVKDCSLNSLTVDGKVGVQNLSTNDLITNNSFISPQSIRKDLKLASMIEGPIKFENVTIKGDVKLTSINGLNPREDLVTKNTEQIVRKNVTVRNIRTKDVDVHGLINGYNVDYHAYQNTDVLTKVIQGDLHMKKMNITSDLEILGTVSKKKLKIPDDIVLLNMVNQLRGEIIFTSPIEISHLKTKDRLVNGVALSKIRDNFNDFQMLWKQREKKTENEVPDIYSYLNFVNDTYQQVCVNNWNIQKKLKNVYLEPFSVESVYSINFKRTKGAKNYWNEKEIENDRPVFSFRAKDSTLWLIDSLHYDCQSKFFKWNDKSSHFIMKISRNFGKVKTWVDIYDDSDFIYLLAIVSSEKCDGTGSFLLRMNKKSPSEVEKLQELDFAENAIVDQDAGSVVVYLELGYKTEKYIFDKETGYLLFLEESSNVPQVERIVQSNGKELTFRTRSNFFLEMDDGKSMREISFDNLRKVYLTQHRTQILLITAQKKKIMHSSYTFYQAFQYKTGHHLKAMAQLKIGSPIKIIPLNIPEYISDSAYILAIYENDSPKIFSFSETEALLWADISVNLKSRVYGFSFIDSEDEIFVEVGDVDNIFVTKFKLNGRKQSVSKLPNCF